MPEWNIYRGDREYAKAHGDPLIGTVTAPTKEDSERIASREFNLTCGPWAQERDENTLQRKGAERIHEIRIGVDAHQPEHRAKTHDREHILDVPEF